MVPRSPAGQLSLGTTSRNGYLVNIIQRSTAIAALIAIPTVTLALSACGGSGPANAASIVAADGYSGSVQNDTPAQLRSDFGDTASQVSSAAGGMNAAGNEEVVVVFDSATDLQSVQSIIGATFAADGLGSNASGAVLRITGSPSAFNSAGGGL